MKITLESTTKMVTLNGVPARVWEGESENGVACFALITLIAVADTCDASKFEEELIEQRAPSPALQDIPLDLILGGAKSDPFVEETRRSIDVFDTRGRLHLNRLPLDDLKPGNGVRRKRS